MSGCISVNSFPIKILDAPCLSQPEPNPNSLKDELDMVVVKKKATSPKTQTIIKHRIGQDSENKFVGLFSNVATITWLPIPFNRCCDFWYIVSFCTLCQQHG